MRNTRLRSVEADIDLRERAVNLGEIDKQPVPLWLGYVAVRTDAKGREYADISTLTYDEQDSSAIAVRADTARLTNKTAKQRTAHTRIALVRIEEVR